MYMVISNLNLRHLHAIPLAGVRIEHCGDAIAIHHPVGVDCRLLLRSNLEGDNPIPAGRLREIRLTVDHESASPLKLRARLRGDGWIASHTELWWDSELPPGPAAVLVLDTRDFRLAQQGEYAHSIALEWNAVTAGFLVLRAVELVTQDAAEYFAARVDRFGQRRAGSWPGKVTDEDELRRDAREPLPTTVTGRDAYGGNAAATPDMATGFFRLRDEGDGWTLITPQGTPFRSFGPCCVSAGVLHEETAGNDELYAWLPPREGDLARAWRGAPPGRRCWPELHPLQSYGHDSEGSVVNLHIANLVRKYGADWHGPWTERTAARLRAWGMNTLACWSDLEAQPMMAMPYLLPAERESTVDLTDLRAGPGDAPFPLRRVPDVFHPDFERRTRGWFAHLAERRTDPWLLGAFVDNEDAWCFWHSPFALPAAWESRRVFIAGLRERYGDIAALNRAWETGFRDFGHLAAFRRERNPPGISAEGESICDDFLRRFADRYFRRVREELRAALPHHLYWGCRFLALPPRQAILDGACPHMDVVSVNWYLWHHQTTADVPSFLGDWHRRTGGKPIAITEYAFEVTDERLLASRKLCTDEDERARLAADFTHRCFELPFVVGCHWFQYIDQPILGRALGDGERAAFGLVDAVDRPRGALVDALAEVGRGLYASPRARAAGGG